MRSLTLRNVAISQASVFLLFLCLTIGNEVLDIPHYVFHDASTSYSQRTGEICIELLIFGAATILQLALFRRLFRRVRLLEGFLPICANCKRVRNTEDQWEQIEEYITLHSLAQFSHGICPRCAKELYPEFCGDKIEEDHGTIDVSAPAHAQPHALEDDTAAGNQQQNHRDQE